MSHKLVLIAYGAGLEADVAEIVAASGATGYTRWERTAGAGRSGGPHLDTSVWPDYNHVTAVAADAATVAGLLDGIRRLRASEGARGLKAFVIPLEEITE
jgi:hypothetical protein